MKGDVSEGKRSEGRQRRKQRRKGEACVCKDNGSTIAGKRYDAHRHSEIELVLDSKHNMLMPGKRMMMRMTDDERKRQ